MSGQRQLFFPFDDNYFSPSVHLKECPWHRGIVMPPTVLSDSSGPMVIVLRHLIWSFWAGLVIFWF